LTQDEQFLLLPKFKEGLQRPRERDAVLQLMQRMRSREDLFAGPAKELADLFAEVEKGGQPPTPPTPPIPQPQPPWHPEPRPVPKSGSATKVLVGILLGLVAAGAVLILLIVNLGSAGPTPNPDPNPPPTTTVSSSDTTPAVGDACVVGDWKSTQISGAVDTNNVRMAVSGGAGTLVTITSDGRLTSDFTTSDPVTYTDDTGTVMGNDQIDGTLTVDLRVSSDGSVKETVVSNDATDIATVNGVAGTPEPATFTADTSYSCSSSTLTLSDGPTETTYTKQ
jgi:hypothetical protein